MGSNSAVGTASRKLRAYKGPFIRKEIGGIPLQHREIKGMLSVGNELLQVCFADASYGIDVR